MPSAKPQTGSPIVTAAWGRAVRRLPDVLSCLFYLLKSEFESSNN
jgi:hypothetical protein